MEAFDPLRKEETVVTPFNPLKQSVAPQPFTFTQTQSGKERSATLLSNTTGKTFEEVAQSVADGSLFEVQQEALGKAQQTQVDNANRVVEESAANQVPPEEAAIVLAEAFNTVPMFTGLMDPAVTAFVLSSDNEAAKRSVFAKLSKMEILYNVANEQLEKADDPWYRDFDWTRSVISGSTPIYSAIAAEQRQDLTIRLNALLDSTLSDEEFAAEAALILEESGDIYDFFGGANRVNLEAFLSAIPEGGYGQSAALDKAFGILDIALLGTPGTLKQTTALATGALKAGKAGITSASVDIARLAGIVRRDPKLVEDIIQRTAIIDDPVHSAAIIGNHTAPSWATSNITRPRYQSAISNTAVQNFEDASELANTVRRIQGPEMIDEKALEVVKQGVIDYKTATGHRQVFDRDVHIDEFENLTYTELYGDTAGKEFVDQAGADALAAQVDGISAKTENGGWIVVRQENISLIDPLKTGKGDNTIEGLVLFETTKIDQLGEGFWAKYGSPLAQTTDLNQALIVQNEATTAALVRQVEKDLKPLLKTLKPSEVLAVDHIFEDLQNGAASARKTAYTIPEFESEFFNKHQRQPSRQEVAYYLKIQELNDLDYTLKADLKFKDEVAKNTVVLRNLPEELNVRPASADSVPDADLMFDADTGAMLTKANLTPDHKIYSVASDVVYKTPGGDYVQYIATRSPRTRRILPEDVMPRNAGGSRRYLPGEAKFFIKQEDEITLAGGRTVAQTPTTFMAVRTQEEALEAVAQVNNITKVIDTVIGRSLKKSATPDEVNTWLRANNNNRQILDAIGQNRRWNTKIASIDALVDFAEQTGMNLRRTTDWAGDGTPLTAGRNDYIPGVNSGTTYGESFRTVGMARGGRKNTPLVGFGGNTLRTAPASESIRKTALSSLAKKSEAAYVASSVNGLIKAAIENKVLLQDAKSSLAGLTLRAKLERLKTLIDTSTVAGRKLKLERDKIEFRINQRSPLDSAWDNFRFKIAESLYKRDGSKFRNGLADRFNKWSTSPVQAMRGWVFDAYLAFGAPDQLYVQASQMVNVIGVADTASAVKAASLYTVNRFLLSNGNDNVIKEVVDRVAPLVGMTSDQYIEMIAMLRESGRTIIDLSIAELGEAASDTVVSRIREKGRFFFKEGELVSTISAHHTAYLELVKNFPNIKPNSQEGRRWIARRQNVLRQAMTYGNRSVGQDLPFFQFLTYTFRVAEAMAAGSLGGTSRKVLTGAEKAKLFGTSLAFYGIAAVPFGGYLLDRIDQKYGVPIDNDVYDAVRWGATDFLLSEVIGADTAVSSRLGFGEGVANTVFSLMDGNIVEALTGPSGSFVSGTTGSLLNLFKSIRSGIGTGEYDVLKMDLSLFARNIRALGLYEQAYVAATLGQYINRTGTKTIASDVTTEEAVAIALGIPLKDVVNMRSLQATMFSNSAYEKKIIARLNTLSTEAERLSRSGDEESAQVIRREIVTELNRHPLAQQQRLFEGMAPEFFSQTEQTLLYSLKQDLNVRNTDINTEAE